MSQRGSAPALTCFLSSRDMMCGKLFCSGGQADPNYGRMVRFGSCKAAFFDDASKDFGQVEEGSRCGEGKVCARLSR